MFVRTPAENMVLRTAERQRRRSGWIVAEIFLGALMLANAIAQPSAVVVRGLEAGAPDVDRGEMLLSELNCTACHAAAPAVIARLAPASAPLLGTAAARMRADYLRAFIRDPVATKPGTTMPALLHGMSDTERDETAALLVQFLESVAPPKPAAAVTLDRAAFEQGRVLFHRVGCVACHAPREPAMNLFPKTAVPTDPDAAQFVLKQLNETSVPLGDLRREYAPSELARFLLDPLATHPTGRMPSLNLTEAEAGAIATYLEFSGPETNPPPAAIAGAAAFVVEAARAKRGRDLFASLGCAACHELGFGQPNVVSTLAAKPLANLNADSPDGCLAATPAAGRPRYQFSDAQRAALRATLAGRARLAQPLTAEEEVATTMVRLDCFACHSRAGYGGPTPSRADYFTTLTDADLGDEGRLPPHLTGVGDKLRAAWLREVLVQRGAVRPYMATRMPQFGAANVVQLVAEFGAADAPPLPAWPVVRGSAEMGRRLVGTNGCSCITCHRYGGRPSLTLSVMDLTQMAKQLKPEWFRQYLLDPTALRPGTRMTSFWLDGKATVQTILGGDTERQIRSIWLYLLYGDRAPPPAGLP
jgi:mono/diheme cytochrome c family protein